MASKKTLADLLFKLSRSSTIQSLTNRRIPQSRSKASIAPDPGPGESSVIRRLLTTDKLRAFDVGRDRIRLDGLRPPPIERSEPDLNEMVTINDAKKLLRVARLETVKSRLKDSAGRDWMLRSEFVRICGEVCSDPEEGSRIAQTLDESGTVLVLGDAVFLKPNQVVKAIGGLIPFPATNPNDPRKKELEQLQQQKTSIDEKARNQVRRELWGGLAYLVIQTAGFMRLTFWELSWDVMEPICFYVTSMYIMAGYGFFLRTSREPTFEGFFESRFLTKQRKLMRARKFDLKRYDELRKICDPFTEQEQEQRQGLLFWDSK
ncbi:Calcium uniporter protein 2, mitochondrial [Linum perenne]